MGSNKKVLTDRATAWCRISVLLATCAALFSCSDDRRYVSAELAGGISGQVNDEKRGLPISGVTVLVRWGNPDTLRERGWRPQVVESSTDEGGRFHVPAPAGNNTPDGKSALAADTQVVFFKNGYQFKEVRVVSYLDAEIARGEASVESRRLTAGIEPFFGRGADGGPGALWRVRIFREISGYWRRTRAFFSGDSGATDVARIEAMDYARHLQGLHQALGWIYAGAGCEWKSTPNMVAAIHRQAVEFKRLGVSSDLPLVDRLIPAPGVSDPCGARDHFRTYLAQTESLKLKVPSNIVRMGSGGSVGLSIAGPRQ